MLKFWTDVQEKSDTKIKGYIDIQRAKSDEDMKRHVGALSEEFQGRVKAVAEQFGGLNEKLDSHTEMIGKLVVDMDIVKTNVEFMKDSLKKKVDYEKFTLLENRVSLVELKARK